MNSFFARIRSNLRREKVVNFIKDEKNIFLILFWGFIAFTFLANTLHESYPDEFDNILGGWNLLQGRMLYSGFFTHHGPIGYVIAAIIEIIGGRSFVHFRLIYAIFLFLFFFWQFRFIKNRFKDINIDFLLIFTVFFGVGATYFWGHMLLADNVSAIFLIPVFSLLFIAGFYKRRIFIKDIVLISILTSLSLLSSLAYLYLMAFVALYTLYLYFWRERDRSILSLETIKILIIFAIPYLIFLLTLLVTGSLKDYIADAVVFNQKYYIYNYPRQPGQAINPIRYAIVIAQTFQSNFSSLLLQVRDFNYYFPFNISLAVADVALSLYLILKRKFALAIFVISVLIFANPRSNPLTSSEKDYQSSVYILLSFFAASFAATRIYDELKDNLEYGKKIIYSLLFILLITYTFFNGSFLLRKFAEKTYDKFMGFQAAIYDRPLFAPLVNTLATKDDYAWIGPFAFEDMFYMNAKPPSKYQILIPGIGLDADLHDPMMVDFNNHKPKVIYFDSNYAIFGTNPQQYAPFFMEYLKNNYIRLVDFKDGKIKYTSSLPHEGPGKMDIDANLYINKENKDEVIQNLLTHNLIHIE